MVARNSPLNREGSATVAYIFFSSSRPAQLTIEVDLVLVNRERLVFTRRQKIVQITRLQGCNLAILSSFGRGPSPVDVSGFERDNAALNR